MTDIAGSGPGLAVMCGSGEAGDLGWYLRTPPRLTSVIPKAKNEMNRICMSSFHIDGTEEGSRYRQAQ